MNSLTVVELKKLAKQKGIKGYSKLRKGELLSALNRSPSRSKSPKVRKSRSRSGKRRSVKSPKSRSDERSSGKKDYTISIKPYFVQRDDNYAPSDAEIGKFIQKHAVKEIKTIIDDIEIFNNGSSDIDII